MVLNCHDCKKGTDSRKNPNLPKNRPLCIYHIMLSRKG